MLKIHPSFLKPLEDFIDSGKIKGLAHITGGGLIENIPRILPGGLSVEIRRGSWVELPIFGLIQRLGNIEDSEMFRTFNMGIGMVLICTQSDKDFFIGNLQNCFEIGEVVEGNRTVTII